MQKRYIRPLALKSSLDEKLKGVFLPSRKYNYTVGLEGYNKALFRFRGKYHIMKRALFLLILLCSCAQLMAQQRPQYTQYVFNNFLLNPALSGIENYTDVKAGYRSQWQGLQGAHRLPAI